jgi:hypothetical protein
MTNEDKEMPLHTAQINWQQPSAPRSLSLSIALKNASGSARETARQLCGAADVTERGWRNDIEVWKRPRR